MYTLTTALAPGASYTIHASRLGYVKRAQPLLIDSVAGTSATVVIDFALATAIGQLAEVTVRAPPPILVSGDTTIYDIPHFAEARDRTLEDVLARVPGIRVDANGAIAVDGRAVDMVLINGKQVADAGTALLTRSLSADDVERVEVRFDERDERLKESLLDARQLVVLDITLKSEVGEALFGRAAATAGHGLREGPVVGGNLNAFSLTERLNVHAFGESDRLGRRTISLRDVDNIGREAWAEVMSLPADFAELERREAFAQELYGFRDYVASAYHVGGAGARYELGEHTTLFAGSYNAIEEIASARTSTQRFLGVKDGVFGFAEADRLHDRSTKDKLEITHTRNGWKVDIDANVVAFRQNDRRELAVDDAAATTYVDRRRHRSVYANALLEYAPTPRAGAHLRVGYANERTRHDRDLRDLSPTLAGGFAEALGVGAEAYEQDLDHRSHTWQADGYGQVGTPIGVLRGGLRLGRGAVEVTRAGMARAGGEVTGVSELTTGATERVRRSLTPYFKYLLGLGGVSVSAEVAHATVHYPDANGGELRVNSWEVDALAEGGLGPFQLAGMYRRGLSTFPLFQVVPGLDLAGTQALSGRGDVELRPRFESVAQADASARWREARVEVNAAVLAGSTRASPQVSTAASPVFVERFAQLPARYVAVSTSVVKRFANVPLTLTLEPEWLTNLQEAAPPSGEPYEVRTDRLLLGLKARTAFPEAIVNLDAHAKYSDFRFRVAGDATPASRQRFASVDVTPRLDLLGHRLLVDPRVRYVRFLNDGARDNVILDAGVRVPGERLSYALRGGNLLGADAFVQRALTPAVLSLEEREVFGRFVRAEVTYRF